MKHLEREIDAPVGLVPTTAFKKVASLTERVRCIRGGQSAGKTFAILQYLVYYALKRKLTISIVAESIPTLKRGAYGDFQRILEALGLYDDSKHNKTDRIYKLNDSVFQFFGCEEPTKLKGLRSEILFMNEANNCPWQSWFELSSRTRLFSILDWNPDAPFWADERLIGNDGVDFITLTFEDNEALEPALRDEIKSWEKLGENDSYYRNLWLTRGLGQLGKLEGVIFSNWTEIEQVPDNAELIGSALDWGYSNDPTACLSVYRYDTELIVDEVLYQKGLFNSQIAAHLKTTTAKNAIIYYDSAEPKSGDELRAYGLPMLPVFKGKDSVNYGISLIQERPFRVTSGSKNLIKELQNYKWATDKDGKSLNVPIDNWNHLCDCLRYLFLMKFNNKKNTFSLKWKK